MNMLIEKLAVLVIAAGVIALIAEGDIQSTSPAVIAGQVAALALIAWSRASFPRASFAAGAAPLAASLITAGPYSVLRHPIYAGALLFFWSTVLGHWSLLNGGIALVVTATILIRIPVEEALLRARYPEYEAYALRTRRLIPFVW
jgi:protein-S-isoprenylcysteine O-methyltransferase Ste14